MKWNINSPNSEIVTDQKADDDDDDDDDLPQRSERVQTRLNCVRFQVFRAASMKIPSGI
jgi:hypothetical protein